MHATFCFYVRGIPVYLESTAPGMKMQPYHLSWADPDCTGMGEAPERLQYIGDISIWGNTKEECFKKRNKIIQVVLKAFFFFFAIKQSKIKGPVQEIQVLRIKWENRCYQIRMDQ